MTILLEDLTENILIENGVTPLMGMDFITDTLGLTWKKMERMFVKCTSEFSENKPRDAEIIIAAGSSAILPENIISVKAVRYGFLEELPRFMFETFQEEGLQWDLSTRELKVFPPITQIRVAYTRGLNVTNDVLITDSFKTIEGESELEGMLRGTYRTGTLTVTKGLNSMSVTEVNSNNVAFLSGTLGTGTLDLTTREFVLSLDDTSAGITEFKYYPKYKAVIDFDIRIGHKVFPKLYAYHLLTAISALRLQADQESLHNLSITSDQLDSRVIQLEAEVKALMKSSVSFSAMMNI